MEATNARYLESLPEPIDLAAIDLSFIFLRLVVPQVRCWLRPDGDIVALIKPQFEVGREQVGKHGVVRESALHQQVIEEMEAFFQETGLEVRGTCESSLVGPAGNREFFIYAKNLK